MRPIENGKNRCNGAQLRRIGRILAGNATMGPQSSSLKAALNPKSGSRVRSGSQFGVQRGLGEPQRGPNAPLSAIQGFPCRNGLSGMRQQVKGGTFASQPHGPRSHSPMAPWPMTLRSNSPMAPQSHSPTVPQPHGPTVDSTVPQSHGLKPGLAHKTAP